MGVKEQKKLGWEWRKGQKLFPDPFPILSLSYVNLTILSAFESLEIFLMYILYTRVCVCNFSK